MEHFCLLRVATRVLGLDFIDNFLVFSDCLTDRPSLHCSPGGRLNQIGESVILR
jgi:hypothetical protein